MPSNDQVRIIETRHSKKAKGDEGQKKGVLSSALRWTAPPARWVAHSVGFQQSVVRKKGRQVFRTCRCGAHDLGFALSCRKGGSELMNSGWLFFRGQVSPAKMFIMFDKRPPFWRATLRTAAHRVHPSAHQSRPRSPRSAIPARFMDHMSVSYSAASLLTYEAC